jgi:hypothetical protein
MDCPLKTVLLTVVTFLSFSMCSMSGWAAESSDSPSLSGTQAPVTPTPDISGSEREGQRGERMKKGMHKMKEACGADINKHCSTVEPGGGRIVQCLEKHQSEVSSSCQQLLQKKASRQGKGR